MPESVQYSEGRLITADTGIPILAAGVTPDDTYPTAATLAANALAPKYGLKLDGSIDEGAAFNTFLTAVQGIRTDLNCRITNGSAVVTDTSIAAGDLWKIVGNSGPTLNRIIAVTPGVGFTMALPATQATGPTNLTIQARSAAYVPAGARLLSSVPIVVPTTMTLITDWLTIFSTVPAGRTAANCVTTNTSTTVAVADADPADQYRPITGAGIPTGTYITAVTPGVSWTISRAATASATVSITTGGAPALRMPAALMHRGHIEVDGSLSAAGSIGLLFQQGTQHSKLDSIHVHDFSADGSWGCQWTHDGSSGSGIYYNDIRVLRLDNNYGNMRGYSAGGSAFINSNHIGSLNMSAAKMVGLELSFASGFSVSHFRCENTAGRIDAGCGTTNTSPTVTDTAAIATDINRSVTGAGIPTGTYITAVTPGVGYTLNNNATATATVSLTIGGDAISAIGVQGLQVAGGWFEGNNKHLVVIGTDPAAVAGIFITAIKDSDATKIIVPDSTGLRTIRWDDGVFTTYYDRLLYLGGTGIQVSNVAGDQINKIKPNGFENTRAGDSFYDQSGSGRMVFRTKETDGAVTQRAIISKAGLVQNRLDPNLGTALVAGDFALSGGWGTTAVVGSIVGTDQAAEFTITSAGTGQGANPTCTLTFKNGTWTNSPVVVVQRKDRTNQPTVSFTWTVTATTLVITFVGTPVAAETYIVSFVAMGR